MIRTALAAAFAVSAVSAVAALSSPALAFFERAERPGFDGYVINDENANRRHTNALREPFLRTRNQGLLGAYIFREGAGPVIRLTPERQRRLERRR